LHHRRDDWQQLLRRAFGDGGKTDDNIEELDVLTYDGVRLRVGATSDEELEQIIRSGGRREKFMLA